MTEQCITFLDGAFTPSIQNLPPQLCDVATSSSSSALGSSLALVTAPAAAPAGVCAGSSSDAVVAVAKAASTVVTFAEPTRIALTGLSEAATNIVHVLIDAKAVVGLDTDSRGILLSVIKATSNDAVKELCSLYSKGLLVNRTLAVADAGQLVALAADRLRLQVHSSASAPIDMLSQFLNRFKFADASNRPSCKSCNICPAMAGNPNQKPKAS